MIPAGCHPVFASPTMTGPVRNSALRGEFAITDVERTSMNRSLKSVIVLACCTWPAFATAQTAPAPSGGDAERNAFQTPTTSGGQKGEPGYVRDSNPLAASQGPATNSEGKNITEPTNRPSKPSPNSPGK
jgi:hypothetical protein